MATNKPQADFQKQGVRIPRDLHNRIHEAAAASGRSYNSELIARLEASFIPAGPATNHIQFLQLTKTQRQTFLANLERSLQIETDKRQVEILKTLRKAALEELQVIDQQLGVKSD